MLRALARLVAPPLCAGCLGHAGGIEPLCRGCRSELRWLGAECVLANGVRVWAPVAYEGPARGMVKALKFGRIPRMAETMASQIAANAPPGAFHHMALVPVPLHPARMRTRGFNQAERLAAALAERTGLPLSDCLERAGARGTQVGRGRAARLAGISGHVRVRADAAPPRRALLVDDVVTTGATLSAAARALAAAGAERVGAVAYARTPGR